MLGIRADQRSTAVPGPAEATRAATRTVHPAGEATPATPGRSEHPDYPEPAPTWSATQAAHLTRDRGYRITRRMTVMGPIRSMAAILTVSPKLGAWMARTLSTAMATWWTGW